MEETLQGEGLGRAASAGGGHHVVLLLRGQPWGCAPVTGTARALGGGRGRVLLMPRSGGRRGSSRNSREFNQRNETAQNRQHALRDLISSPSRRRRSMRKSLFLFTASVSCWGRPPSQPGCEEDTPGVGGRCGGADRPAVLAAGQMADSWTAGPLRRPRRLPGGAGVLACADGPATRPSSPWRADGRALRGK